MVQITGTGVEQTGVNAHTGPVMLYIRSTKPFDPMKTKLSLFAGSALLMLAMGCAKPSERQSNTDKLGMDEQLLAVLPVLDRNTVLKVCDAKDDHGNLSFSFVAEKPDPNDPGKTIAADQLSLEKQVAMILPLVDADHAFIVRSTTDEASGHKQLVFTIQRNGNGLKDSGKGAAKDEGSPS